jgi:peptidoglycan/xylan/chitin deacetylase (PgdA/CDA1 family)
MRVARAPLIVVMAVPTVAAQPSRSLLDLWTPEVLRGRPGDERITRVRPPDRSPPTSTEVDRLPAIEPSRRGSIRRVRMPDGEKLVALTFDLCEQADDRTGYDRDVVNYLRDHRVPATFFAGGKWMRSHEDKAMQLMADPDFEIGNHGWTHGNLRVLGGDEMRAQIVWTQAEYALLHAKLAHEADTHGLGDLAARVPSQPLLLRFPYGTCSAESLGTVNDLGLDAIQWDVISGDPVKTLSAETIARGVLANARPGSIIVFHANGRTKATAAALPRVVEGLAAKGFGFRTVSALLREGTPETSPQCYDLRPGDNRWIDAKFGKGTE